MRKLLFLLLSLWLGTLSAQRVVFSQPGGYQDAPFQLTLSAEGDTCAIYYTLDGTIPTARNAMRYTAPLDIAATTPVSALCVGPSGAEYAYATRTYIFLSDVYRQPAAPKGYPSEWTSGYKADYAMDQSITLGATYGARMDEAMRAIPVVCLTTSVSNLFDRNKGNNTGGIYIFPEEKGEDKEWERPCSVEYYDAEGSIQECCGVRIHGGNSRKPGNTPKHSFRISMRKQYGAGKLKYKIFDDDDAAKKFDHLVLRAGYNYSWLKNGSTKLYPGNIIQRTNAQYIIDSWTKEAAHAMGHTMTHRRFVHLFLNGLYWGLYEACEHIGNKFAVQYLGGLEDDWDVVEDHTGVIDGSRETFATMFGHAQRATKDNADYRALSDESLLDLDQYIDYMLLQWYIGNEDWDENNWRAMRNRTNPGQGFVFMVWDAEMGLIDVNTNKVTMKKGEPTQMMAALRQNPAFVARVQRRVEQHLLHNGILTPDSAAALYQRLSDEIDLAIIGESARWGDYRKMTGETDVTYTRDEYWDVRRQDLLAHYFPQRTAILLKQLQDAGLFDPNAVAGIASLNAEGHDGATPAYDLQGRRLRGIGMHSADDVLPQGRLVIQDGRKRIVAE